MAYEIEIKDLEQRYVATIRTTTTPDRIGETFRELLPEVMAQLTEAGAQPPNPPFGIYHTYTKDEVDLEVGVPLLQPIPSDGRVVGRELLVTGAAGSWHLGPHGTIGRGFSA